MSEYKGMPDTPLIFRIGLPFMAFFVLAAVVNLAILLPRVVGIPLVVAGAVGFVWFVRFIRTDMRQWDAKAKASREWWARYGAATTYEERSALLREKESA